jgi:hypothetical protein
MYYIIVEPRHFGKIAIVADEVSADKWIRNHIDELNHSGSLCLICSEELRDDYCELSAMKRYRWVNRKINTETYTREPDTQFEG